MGYIPLPNELLDLGSRWMFVFAHQDDELPYAGLLQRAPVGSRFLWVTNGDGLYRDSGLSRNEYAEARRLETTVAMRTLGLEESKLRFLRHSEIEVYQTLVHLAHGGRKRSDAAGAIQAMRAKVRAELAAFKPDVVFTLAWQGGHPEHDLVHMLVRSCLPTDGRVRLYELPQYELAYSYLLRFGPRYAGTRHRIVLTWEELHKKKRAVGCYPTQAKLLHRLLTLLQVRSRLKHPLAGAQALDDFLAMEEFGEVPPDRDYTRSPHRLDLLEYPGEDYEGTPIRYSTMVAEAARCLF